MMNRILASLAAVLALCAGTARAAPCDSLSTLEWLLGDWQADGAKSSWQESWHALGPTSWEGRGVETPKSGQAPSTEALRLLEMGGGVFYIAKVTHNELPVAFRLAECDGGRFAFVNPVHDFPRRLEYRREDNGGLTVGVSDGAGQGFTLEFARQAAGPRGAAAVLDAEDARFTAMVQGDAAGMRRSFAEDLAYVHSTGETQGRDGLIAAINDGQLRYRVLAPADRQVVFLGADSAYVQGRVRIQVEVGGREADFQARYLAIYGRSGGNWQLRAWQSLRLP